VDDWLPSSPLACSEADVARWNAEWLDYLSREWPYQLTPWTAFPPPPPLPPTARELLDLHARPGWELALYCDPEWLSGRRVMELGCGCGGLGKLLGGWVESYLGTDYSTLALQVARLVSPPRCTYLHVSDAAALAAHHGSVETVLGRYFWIHQNLELGRANLDFLTPFLAPGGRVYADFFCPDPAQEQFVVRRPDDPLSRRWPSAMFHYEVADVERLVAGRPFRLLREEVVVDRQRRYAVLERTG
jgi:SAM-dependent methyltransferase